MTDDANPSSPPARRAPVPHPATERPTPAADRRTEPREIGGPTGPEPTRYGDWERNGRCSDF